MSLERTMVTAVNPFSEIHISTTVGINALFYPGCCIRRRAQINAASILRSGIGIVRSVSMGIIIGDTEQRSYPFEMNPAVAGGAMAL